MHGGSRTTVRDAVELTKWFNIKVELHQELALSFAIVIDRLTKRDQRRLCKDRDVCRVLYGKSKKEAEKLKS